MSVLLWETFKFPGYFGLQKKSFTALIWKIPIKKLN